MGFFPSFIKTFIYRIKGYKIAKNVSIGFGSIIVGNEINIGKNTNIGHFTILLCKSCIIDKEVEIGSLCYFKVDKIKIGYQTIIRERNMFGGMDIGSSELIIGEMSQVHQNCLINTTLPVQIGNCSAIGGGSYLFTHSAWQSVLEGYPSTYAPIIIGNNVWISWGVFILPGVQVGDDSLISAGSVVTKNIPAKCLAQGNPAKVVIPEGLYPRNPHPEDRSHKIGEIIDLFINYLRKHDYNIEVNKLTFYKVYYISKGKITHDYLLYLIGGDESIIDDLKLNENTVILILNDHGQNFRESVIAHKSVLLNFSNLSICGKNDLSEELLKFLKHFGIRFKPFTSYH
ncbi:MAG: acyltransferase [Bacteroidetes bacterium]|nr:acyltransferase [Bacteroidota bacterium]